MEMQGKLDMTRRSDWQKRPFEISQAAPTPFRAQESPCIPSTIRGDSHAPRSALEARGEDQARNQSALRRLGTLRRLRTFRAADGADSART